MKTFIKTFVLAAVLVGLNLPAMAIDLSATEITQTKGRVEVKKTSDAVFKKLHKNLKLAGSMKRLDGGDKVRTYDASSAEMALKDTCILGVKEQSIFEVPQILGQEAIRQLTAQQGNILFKVVSGSNFQVQTADVIAGVKGTLFELDIIDNFVCILETPALQIGTITPGATNVNVYKGEVELTHRATGEKRSLKAGEGLAALSSSLMQLDQLFSSGFTPLRKFNPSTLLTQNFGSGVGKLLEIDASLGSLGNLQGLGGFNERLAGNRLTNMFGGLDSKIQKAVGGFERGREILDNVKEISEAFGKGYQADFSKFRRETRGFSITDNRFREVYLGNAAFAAGKAWAGSRIAKCEPLDEGLQLAEGHAAFRVNRFKNANTDIEFLVSYYVSGKQLITTIHSLKGDLYGRIPGNLEHFKIPAGKTAYVYDSETGSGNWAKASADALPQDLLNYNFKVAERLAQEKKQHDKKSTEKKKELGKKVLDRIKIKKFW